MPSDGATPPAGAINTGLETVGHAECLSILRHEDVGRLGVVVAGRPEIFPVNFVTDHDGTIVFRTGPGTKLAGALGGPVVFEVDHIDRVTGSGWSVVVHGETQRVGPAEAAALQSRLARCAVQPAPGGDKTQLFRVSPSTVSGRRIPPPRKRGRAGGRPIGA